MVYENNEVKEKNGWKYKEQKLVIDTGDRVNDVNIQEAIIHVLDKNVDEPILNNFTLELNENIYKFLYKHIEKLFRDEALKPAVFNSERNIVKEIVKDYLNGIDKDIITLSQELAKQLFCIMKWNKDIESSDFIVTSIITDQGPLIGVLKLDYVDRFTHAIEFVDNKIGIEIVPQVAGLPSSTKRIHKAAFIKPIREDQKFDLWIIDKQKKVKEVEEYGTNYFTDSFLGCYPVSDSKLLTKTFINAAEIWTRSNITEDAEKAEMIRSTIKEKLITEDIINIDAVAETLFKEEPRAKVDFLTYVKAHGLEDDIKVDKKYVEKKLKRVRLNIDKDIDLYISQEAYTDKSKFEITRNGDGTINMTIKYVRNYIEKESVKLI